MDFRTRETRMVWSELRPTDLYSNIPSIHSGGGISRVRHVRKEKKKENYDKQQELGSGWNDGNSSTGKA